MATRFYLSSTTSVLTPTPGASWNDVTQVQRRPCSTTKDGSALSIFSVSETSATSGWSIIRAQFITDTLAAQTISGTVQGQIQTYESSTSANMCRAFAVYLWSPGSDTYKTLLTHFPASVTSEFVRNALTNRYFPPTGTAITSTASAANDRLILEVGLRAFNTATSIYYGSFSFGSASATDLPVNETEIVTYNPWVQFSANLVFSTGGTPVPVFMNSYRRRRAS